MDAMNISLMGQVMNYLGINPPPAAVNKGVRGNKYKPHQNADEKARRSVQRDAGELDFSASERTLARIATRPDNPDKGVSMHDTRSRKISRKRFR